AKRNGTTCRMSGTGKRWQEGRTVHRFLLAVLVNAPSSVAKSHIPANETMRTVRPPRQAQQWKHSGHVVIMAVHGGACESVMTLDTPKPYVEAFHEDRTFSVQYVVSDPATRKCAIIDPVMDFDEKSGSTATRSADEILAFIAEK